MFEEKTKSRNQNLQAILTSRTTFMEYYRFLSSRNYNIELRPGSNLSRINLLERYSRILEPKGLFDKCLCYPSRKVKHETVLYYLSLLKDKKELD